MAGASSSLKEYLKRYQDGNEEEDKKKKKKKKKAKQVDTGVVVVDEDPVWQKPVRIEEEEENDSAGKLAKFCPLTVYLLRLFNFLSCD